MEGLGHDFSFDLLCSALLFILSVVVRYKVERRRLTYYQCIWWLDCPTTSVIVSDAVQVEAGEEGRRQNGLS